jgi:aminoglycoside phosphotransferase (APT) family kinase protein
MRRTWRRLLPLRTSLGFPSLRAACFRAPLAIDEVSGVRVYSRRLGPIADRQLQAALDRFELGRLVSAEPITTGQFGQNLFLTSTAGEFVLRGRPHTPWQFPKERFLTDLLHERTSAPVAWPYLWEPSEDLFGWSFAITPRLPGLQIAEHRVWHALGLADRRGLARAFAAALAELHRVTWPFAAEEYALGSGTMVPRPGPTSAWLAEQVERNLRSAVQQTSRTRRDDVAWALALAARAAEALDVPCTPAFVHRDFQRGNLVAEPVDGEWRVTGLFDLMTGAFGDPELDLARPFALFHDEDPTSAREFFGAYAAQRPLREGSGARFRAYMLLDRSILWEYFQRVVNRGSDRGPAFRDWIEPHLALDPLGTP